MTNNPEIPNECECCPTTRVFLKTLTLDLEKMHGMWMCPSCRNKEKQLQEKSKAEAQMRVDAMNATMNANQLIEKAKQIDQSIQLTTDVFNANTVAIMDLKSAIDNDASITNKQFALAEVMVERINHFQQVMTDHRKGLVEAQNAQRMFQTHLNTLANQLRQEERDKLKLQDINYNPEKPKVIKPKSDKNRGRKSKFDKDEVRNLAAQYNVPMEAIAMLITSKNMSAADAAKHMAKMLHGVN